MDELIVLLLCIELRGRVAGAEDHMLTLHTQQGLTTPSISDHLILNIQTTLITKLCEYAIV